MRIGDWSEEEKGAVRRGIRSYCPRCRELNVFPDYLRLGERVKCTRCGAEYALSGATAPSLLSGQRVRGLVVAVVLVGALAVGLYFLWARFAGGGAEPIVTDSSFRVVGGDIVYKYTLENRGRRGLVGVRPQYWTASGKLVDVSALREETVEMRAGEMIERTGRAVVWGKEWPVGFRVECWAVR